MLNEQQQDELSVLCETLKEDQTVSLDHVLVIIQHAFNVKTQNLALQAKVKNMEALLEEQSIDKPHQDKGSHYVPEVTPQPAIENDTMDMLDQINNLERKEKLTFLEKSMGPGGFGNSLFQSTMDV